MFSCSPIRISASIEPRYRGWPRSSPTRTSALSVVISSAGRSGAGSPVAVYWRMERWLRLQESVLHSCVGVTGAIYAMHRGDWKDLGAEVLCDDLYVPMRLVRERKRVVFEPNAMARDARDVPTADEFHRKVRTLTGNFQLCFTMKDVLLPSRNPIWFQFVCHKLLRLLSPYLLIGFILSLLLLAAEMLPLPTLIFLLLLLPVTGVDRVAQDPQRGFAGHPGDVRRDAGRGLECHLG